MTKTTKNKELTLLIDDKATCYPIKIKFVEFSRPIKYKDETYKGLWVEDIDEEGWQELKRVIRGLIKVTSN